MEDEGEYAQWAEDAEVLANIGRAFFAQPTRVTVRLSRELADLAVASWERETADGPLPVETEEQSLTRHRAGTLSLIGLSIQEVGVVEGDDVIVELDAWHIGNALEAADDRGLIVP